MDALYVTLFQKIEGHDYLLPADIESDVYIYSIIVLRRSIIPNQFKPGIALCSKDRAEKDHADYYNEELDKLTTSRIVCVVVESFFLRSYNAPLAENLPSKIRGNDSRAHGRSEIRAADDINCVIAKFKEVKQSLAGNCISNNQWADFALTFLDGLLTKKEKTGLEYLKLNRLTSMSEKAVSADSFKHKILPLLAKLDKKDYRPRPRIN